MCFNLSETYAELDAKRDEITKGYLEKNNELKCKIDELKCKIGELEATINELNTKNEKLKKKNKKLKKKNKWLMWSVEWREQLIKNNALVKSPKIVPTVSPYNDCFNGGKRK